jgi:hypothetical protein
MVFLKKSFVIIVLILLAFYWLLDHASPYPLNHEMFGLYYHNVHRALGVFLFVLAGLAWWMWKPRNK